MGRRFNGPEQAKNLLRNLGASEQSRILEEIGKQDPKLAEELKAGLLDFEQLSYMTPKMLADFFKEVSPQVFGLALRGIEPAIREKFLTQISRGLAAQINETLLGPPKPVDEVEKAQQEVLAQAQVMIAQGRVILDPDRSNIMV